MAEADSSPDNTTGMEEILQVTMVISVLTGFPAFLYFPMQLIAIPVFSYIKKKWHESRHALIRSERSMKFIT